MRYPHGTARPSHNCNNRRLHKTSKEKRSDCYAQPAYRPQGGDAEATVELVSTFDFPVFERETEYVSLVSDGPDYPLLSGDLGSSEGIRMNKRDYRSMTNEFIVPHSSAKHTKLSRDAYAVGALSRLNMNYNKLHPLARKNSRKTWDKAQMHKPIPQYRGTTG